MCSSTFPSRCGCCRRLSALLEPGGVVAVKVPNGAAQWTKERWLARLTPTSHLARRKSRARQPVHAAVARARARARRVLARSTSRTAAPELPPAGNAPRRLSIGPSGAGCSPPARCRARSTRLWRCTSRRTRTRGMPVGDRRRRAISDRSLREPVGPAAAAGSRRAKRLRAGALADAWRREDEAVGAVDIMHRRTDELLAALPDVVRFRRCEDCGLQTADPAIVWSASAYPRDQSYPSDGSSAAASTIWGRRRSTCSSSDAARATFSPAQRSADTVPSASTSATRPSRRREPGGCARSAAASTSSSGTSASATVRRRRVLPCD